MTDEPAARARRARSFNEVAELYLAVRPGYPGAAIDDLVDLAGLRGGGRALEVGAGSGQLTVPLAERGLRVVALEPGADTALIARRRLATFPRVRVEEVRLEDWPLEASAFDLVISASAWHWIDQEPGFGIAHDALRPHGVIALLWNVAVAGPGSIALHEVVQPAYVRWAPELGEEYELTEPDRADHDGDGLRDTPLFNEFQIHRYPWREQYTADRYVDLLRTFSDHIVLPSAVAASLLADIRDRIERNLGGVVVVDRVTVMKTAHRASPGTDH
jgi:SAM-dependent methyltransferase